MNEEITCKECGIIFDVTRNGLKSTNGSWIRFYENGVKVSTLKCYKCFRVSVNSKWDKSRREKAREYERTIDGLLMRTYRNMQSRVEGIQVLKSHLYLGLELLDRQDFYDWARSDKDFLEIYNAWVESGYERRLAPSINRIDPSMGYVLSNMRWLTHSENSRLGALSKNF